LTNGVVSQLTNNLKWNEKYTSPYLPNNNVKETFILTKMPVKLILFISFDGKETYLFKLMV